MIRRAKCYILWCRFCFLRQLIACKNRPLLSFFSLQAASDRTDLEDPMRGP